MDTALTVFHWSFFSLVFALYFVIKCPNVRVSTGTLFLQKQQTQDGFGSALSSDNSDVTKTVPFSQKQRGAISPEYVKNRQYKLNIVCYLRQFIN